MGQLGGVLWVYFKALIFHDWAWNGPGLTDWIFWVAWWMSYKFSVWLREIPGLLWDIRLGSRSSQEGDWGLQGVSRRYPHYSCHKFGPKFGDSVTKICTCDNFLTPTSVFPELTDMAQALDKAGFPLSTVSLDQCITFSPSDINSLKPYISSVKINVMVNSITPQPTGQSVLT